MDNTFLYGFEYLGSAKREPITPWTERVFLSLTLAIKSFKAGLCMGTPVSIVIKCVNIHTLSLINTYNLHMYDNQLICITLELLS